MKIKKFQESGIIDKPLTTSDYINPRELSPYFQSLYPFLFPTLGDIFPTREGHRFKYKENTLINPLYPFYVPNYNSGKYEYEKGKEPWGYGGITNGLRYAPTVSRDLARQAESKDYYLDFFDKNFFGENGITKEGYEWMKLLDEALLKANPDAKGLTFYQYDENNNPIYDEDGQYILRKSWDYRNNPNVDNKYKQLFTDVRDLIRAQAYDGLGGSRHNLFNLIVYTSQYNGKIAPLNGIGNPVFSTKLLPNAEAWVNGVPSIVKTFDITDKDIKRSTDLITGTPTYTEQEINDRLTKLRNIISNKPIDNTTSTILTETLPVELQSENDKEVLETERTEPYKPSRMQTFWNSIKTSFKNKDRSPFLDDVIRTAAVNIHNTWNTNKYARELTAPLSTYTPSYREVYGDYNALMLGLQLAARLRNQRPLTSNAEVLGALDQEAIAKGNLAIQLGNLLDTLTFRQTSEKAWLQYKENNLGWNTVANAYALAISKLANTRAELRYDARSLNMNNWNTLFEDASKRRWKLYLEDVAEKKAAEKAIKNLELNNLLYPTKYREKMTKWQELKNKKALGTITPGETAELSELDIWVSRAEPVLFYLKILNLARQQGIDYTLPSGFIEKDGRVDYEKNPLYNKLGGKLFANGGLVATHSVYVEPRTYSEKKSSSSSSSDSASEEDKEELKLKKEIVETLKGIKGNPSDVARLSGYLSSFFATQRYNPLSGLNDLYTGYITALNLVNLINSSSKTFDEVYKKMDKEGALNSPAMDSNGNVYVGVAGTGKIDRIKPEDYLEDMKKPKELRKYQLLYNSTLLSLRKDDIRFAFQDDIMFDAASNGVSMKSINEYIKSIIDGLGTNEESLDKLVRAMGPQGVAGLQTLVLLVGQGISDKETSQIIASLNALTELNLTTKSLEKLAELAIASIGAMLPPNMRTTLLLQAGSEENLAKLITALVFKNIDATVKFDISDFNTVDENGNIVSSKSNKGSGSGEPKEESQDLFLKSLQKGYGGEAVTVTINPGTKAEMSQRGVNYYVGSAGPLSDVLKETTIGGIANPSKIYFGDLLIDPAYLDDVAFLNRGVTRLMLPTKNDGSPDFTIFERFDKACDKVRAQGYDPFLELDKERKETALALLGKELKAEDLYGLLMENGLPNLKRIGLFAAVDCLTSDVAGIHASSWVQEVKDPDWSKFKSLLSKRGPDGKYKEYDKIDEFNWWNPADYKYNWHSHLYQGTVYIPLSNNEAQATISAGNKVKDSTIYLYEGNSQRWENIVKSGRNPGEHSSDKLNLNETE